MPRFTVTFELNGELEVEMNAKSETDVKKILKEFNAFDYLPFKFNIADESKPRKRLKSNATKKEIRKHFSSKPEKILAVLDLEDAGGSCQVDMITQHDGKGE